jgi:hypothetical protein
MKKGIREGEREVGGDGVCGCSFGEPLKQETFHMRYKLFHNLSWLPNDCAIDLKLLTSGNPILSNEQNEII